MLVIVKNYMKRVDFNRRDLVWMGMLVLLVGVSFGYAFGVQI